MDGVYMIFNNANEYNPMLQQIYFSFNEIDLKSINLLKVKLFNFQIIEI